MRQCWRYDWGWSVDHLAYIAFSMQNKETQPAAKQYASSATRMLERRRKMIELQQALGEQQAVYAEKASCIMRRKS